MKRIIPTLLCDFYKVSHKDQYPAGTEKIYSTWTPRMSRIPEIKNVVAFGYQGFIKEYLIDFFNTEFFSRDVEDVCSEYERYIKYCLGVANPDSSHIRSLHKLGYMPIKIQAVPEGVAVPLRTPMLTIENTIPEFFWITNYLESIMSTELWSASTSATIAKRYREILDRWAIKTTGSTDGVGFQGHDFSFRGMGSLEMAMKSGAGHLLSFDGTDTIPAIMYLEQYYNANIENELVGASLPATEHSVQCVFADDKKYFDSMITDVYPSGLVSIVADGYDYWNMIGTVIPSLKAEIMQRDGKTVVRPDSGNPVDIICGTAQVVNLDNEEYIKSLEECQEWMADYIWEEVRNSTPHGECGDDEQSAYFKYQGKIYKIVISLFWNRYDKQYYYIDEVGVDSCEEATLTLEEKGTIEALWDIFGGTINEQGYKVLDPHIGAIYGDSITMDRAQQICSRLADKGFASTNTTLGLGSFSYQYVTRDTFGYAMKATYAVVDGKERLIFKDPKTDDGTKKSQKGMVNTFMNADGEIVFEDCLGKDDVSRINYSLFRTVFQDGSLLIDDSLADIRARIRQ